MSKEEAVLIAAFLSGCSVTPQDFDEAKRLCESHGGVRWLYPAQFGADKMASCVDSSFYKFEIRITP